MDNEGTIVLRLGTECFVLCPPHHEESNEILAWIYYEVQDYETCENFLRWLSDRNPEEIKYQLGILELYAATNQDDELQKQKQVIENGYKLSQDNMEQIEEIMSERTNKADKIDVDST